MKNPPVRPTRTKTRAKPDARRPATRVTVIKDDHMPAEPETQRGSWGAYAMTIAVGLPALYVLSSGPAQSIVQSKVGASTLRVLSAPEEIQEYISYCQGSHACRWLPPLARVYSPLAQLEKKLPFGNALNWYWDACGAEWKNVFAI